MNARSADRGRPPPEARGVLGQRLRLVAPELAQPDEEVGDCPPRRETAPDVSEQNGQRRDTEPEDHVDPGRREVPEGVGVAEQRGHPDEDEHCDGDDLHRDPHRPENDPGERRRQWPAALALVEERPAPQDAEQDEGHHEDDGRRPVEEPRRHGEVLDPPDAVCDEPGADQGRTSITARSASGWWSSSSNRPGRFAVKGIRTGSPAVTGFSMS